MHRPKTPSSFLPDDQLMAAIQLEKGASKYSSKQSNSKGGVEPR